MKERLDTLIRLGMKEDEALGLLKATYAIKQALSDSMLSLNAPGYLPVDRRQRVTE